MLFPNTWPFGMNLARTPAIWRRMFEIIPSPNFGLNYDPSHLVMQLIDPIAPIREFGPRIFHTHAKDMRIDRDSAATTSARSSRRWSGARPKFPGLGDVALGPVDRGPDRRRLQRRRCASKSRTKPSRTRSEGRKRSLRISRNVLQPLIA